MIKTVIAYEDDPALRKQLENIFFAIRNDYFLLASFGEPSEVLLHMEGYKPDMVLMDIQMEEDEDGLIALYKIKKNNPLVNVMMLTTFDTDEKVFNAICLGADGYMLKTDFAIQDMPHEVLRKSLRIMFNGGAYLTPVIAKKILSLFSDHTIAERINVVKEKFQMIFQNASVDENQNQRLSRMQTTVLKKIIDGKTTAEIARELDLKENTINTHIKAIFNILEVHSRTKAVKKAIEEKWIK